MPVIYNGQAIIPAPFFRMQKEYQTTDDGTPIGSVFLITLLGTICFNKGSPNSSGIFWNLGGYPPDETLTSDQQLGSLLTKMKSLRALFATPGQTLEVTGIDSVVDMKCNPRIKEISVQDGNWFNTVPYAVSLEADTITVNGVEDTGDVGTYKVSKASEEWNMEVIDINLGTYRLTHSVSAIGKRFYDGTGTLVKPAWQNAQDYVLNKIGLGLKPARMAADGVLNLDSAQAYNYIRSQAIGELGGTFGVTETWLCYTPVSGQPPAYEEFEVTTRTTLDGRSTVSCQGNITGLGVYNNNIDVLQTTKYANASSLWTATVQPGLFNRAQTISGLTLNPIPVSSSHGANQVAGTIQYTYEYDDRPNAASLITGARSVIISFDYDNPAEVVAKIAIPGRPAGPIIQDMSTITEKRKTISIEAQMAAATYSTLAVQPNTDVLMLSFLPATASPVWNVSDRENFVPVTGRYTRTTTYEWV